MKNLILIGPPGAGKGTQSEKLKEEGYKHISTGDLLRQEVKSGSDLGKKIAQLIDNGNYVSDEMAMDLINKNVDMDSGSYIFDGMPRTENQAKLLLEKVIKEKDYLAIYFDIKDDKLIDRLIYRRSCKSCGKIHNLLNKKDLIDSSKQMTCSSCGSTEFIHRKDDTIEAVPQRIKNFHEKTKPVLDFFKEQGSLIVMDADKTSENLFQELKEIVNEE